MSFTLPGVFRLENNKNNLEKKKIFLLYFPPFLPCAFAIGPLGCRPSKSCIRCLWPLLQWEGEKEVGKGSHSMAANCAWPQ